MTIDFDEKVYFFCCRPEPNWASFQHNLICLGEGLRELGIPFYSNTDYWQLSSETGEYLFQHNPEIAPDDCSIVVLGNEWFTMGHPFPESLFHSNRSYTTVFIDSSDGENTISRSPLFRQFDFIFRTHFNQKFVNPSNYHPWAFGLSNRILTSLKDPISFHQRKNVMLVNFRANKHPHSVRKFIYKNFLTYSQDIIPVDSSTDWGNEEPLNDYDALQQLQTGGRHFPAYYKRLRESAACACFGGFFVSPVPRDQSLLLSRLLKRCLAMSNFKSNRIVQWDSWRFWEALAAGCVAFHIDLEKYGALMPVMPQNWKHYIGVDLDNIDEMADKFIRNPETLELISFEARQWALEHYSPIPTTLRFLETIHRKLPIS